MKKIKKRKRTPAEKTKTTPRVGEKKPARPVRVSKPGADGEQETVSYWCSSKCFKLAHKKPEKKRKGKPSPDSYFHINHNPPIQAA